MKRLPHIQIEPAQDWQKHRLARWFHEWVIDRGLPQTIHDEAGVGVIYRRALVNIPGRDIEKRSLASVERSAQQVDVGQIRLLYPRSEPTRARLWYIAVLQKVRGDVFCVAPFGRFAEPATPGEWLTGRQAPSLRVLCLWNARTVSRTVIENGWLVSELTDPELAHACTILDHYETGSNLPAELAEQIGPPIIHPQDPRREYLEQERADMDSVTAGASQRDGPGGLALVTGTPPDELAMAAESPMGYGREQDFEIRGLSLILRISASSSPGESLATIMDVNGRLSTELDGAVVHGADGSRSDPVSSGRVRLSSSLLSQQIVLVCEDGAVLSLEPRH